MNLVETCQIEEGDLANVNFDIYIGASGYESRATHSLKKLNIGAIPVKWAFGFKDRVTTQRVANDQDFDLHDISIFESEGDSGDRMTNELKALLHNIKATSVKIAIDYSSMTRAWYAGLIKAMCEVEIEASVDCYFIYSPALFSPPLSVSPNATVAPIDQFCGLDMPDRPTALILGLGYERERALGVLEYIDPAVAFAFYTDPAIDNRYRNKVLSNNSILLKQIPPDNVYKHPFLDLQRTTNLLTSLYSGLRQDYRIVLAPLGIKPFSLLCMLLASRFHDVDVWRITGGIKAPAQDRKPIGSVLTLKTTFEKKQRAINL